MIANPAAAAARRDRPWGGSIQAILICCLLVAVDGMGPRSTTLRSVTASRLDPQLQVSAGVDDALATSDVYNSIRSVLVVQGDRTVFEHYYRGSAADAVDPGAATMSVLSSLVGIALGQGLIPGVDATLADLLPAYAPAMTATVATTTLRQVLTMTAGFAGTAAEPDNTFTTAPDWIGDILGSAVRPPGQAFGYSYGSAQLVSAILTAATGMPVLDYARTYLFEPLGIDARITGEPFDGPGTITLVRRSVFAWPVAGAFGRTAWAALTLPATAVARIGRLYLDDGMWQGRRVIPASWVHDATTRQVDVAQGPGSGFGYLWWTTTVDGARAYAGAGYGGQLIEVVPGRRLVVVIETDIDRRDAARVTPEQLTTMVDLFIAPQFR